MYYQLGQFEPWNQFIKNYRNKDILQIFRDTTEVKLIKMNALIKIYIHLHNIEEPITLNKSENNDKNKNYTKPTTRQLQVNLVMNEQG